MCGILIIFSKKGKKLSKSKSLRASKEIYNRGPDSFKFEFFENGSLFISNTILSITGKKKENSSLERSKSGQYIISFNGEIYNYKNIHQKNSSEKINENLTDTKVLANLYDEKSDQNISNNLNGMYAYVIFDLKKKCLKIINDPQGEKNLYYYDSNDYFIISSKISAILKFINNYEINFSCLKNYFLTRHFMPLEDTCFKNIKLFKYGSTINYSLEDKRIIKYQTQNPLLWISEKQYNFFDNLHEDDVIDLFEDALVKQIKLMIPDKRFGCIVSGGIDSTLQALLVSKFKDPKINIAVDYGVKDPIMKNIGTIQYFFNTKIKKIKMNIKNYKKLTQKCYKIVSSPLQTHDLAGRFLLSEKFKEEKCKVFFSADGVDELLGGQQVYLKTFLKKYDFSNNMSPYSSIQNNKLLLRGKDNFLKDYLDKKWQETLKHYSFIKSKRERNIQASLFLDYFIQSINVANRSNDLICCENSVEPRNVYIQKNILKIILNLPLRYKINEKVSDIRFRQKYILKKVFSKYLNKKNILPKTGFSGFPNELKDKNYGKSKILNKILKKSPIKHTRALEWKIINLEQFLKQFF